MPATKTATKTRSSGRKAVLGETAPGYAPQARRIRRGEAPNLGKARGDSAAPAAPASTVLGTGSLSAHSISATEAREVGENAVTRGALERAERHVSGFQIQPKATDQPRKVWVDPDGKVHDTPPEGPSTQLVGAEADAYAAAHKSADKAPDKARKGKASTKAKGRKATARRKGR